MRQLGRVIKEKGFIFILPDVTQDILYENFLRVGFASGTNGLTTIGVTLDRDSEGNVILDQDYASMEEQVQAILTGTTTLKSADGRTHASAPSPAKDGEQLTLGELLLQDDVFSLIWVLRHAFSPVSPWSPRGTPGPGPEMGSQSLHLRRLT